MVCLCSGDTLVSMPQSLYQHWGVMDDSALEFGHQAFQHQLMRQWIIPANT